MYDAAVVWPLPVEETIAGRYLLEVLLSSDQAYARYRGRDDRAARAVLVEIRRDSGDGLKSARFERAVSALVSLAHPNIASIVDHGVSHGRFHLVTEWLEGESLTSRLARATLTFDEAMFIARQLLAALASAHAVGLVHGNLSASELFLQRRTHAPARVKLLGFRFNETSQTQRVEAPKRVAAPALPVRARTPATSLRVGAAPADARSDVFAAGMLLSELLANHASRAATLPVAVSNVRENAEPALETSERKPATDVALQALIRRATHEHPAERFADAAEMLCALVDALPRASSLAIPEAAPADGAEPDAVSFELPEPPRVVLAAPEPNVASGVVASSPAMVLRPAPLLAALAGVALLAAALFGTPLGEQIAHLPWHALRARAAGLASAVSGESQAHKPRLLHSSPTTTDSSAVLSARSDAAHGGVAPDFRNPTASRKAEPTPNARNPWLDPVPIELQGLPAYVAIGAQGDEHMVHTLRDYDREHRSDARGHLLLGHLYFNRLWRADCVAEWSIALQRDPSARGAPEVLPMLVQLVGQGKVADAAADLIAKAYGREALGALDAALPMLRNSEPAARVRALSARVRNEDRR
jgi:hypothetical protein